jgi:hypothetical protein
MWEVWDRESPIFLEWWAWQLHGDCLRIPFASTKPHDQKTSWGEKGLFWVTLPYCCLSLREVRTEILTEQEPDDKNWCTGHGGMLLNGLFFVAWCLFLIKPRTTSPRLVPPTMDWSLPDRSPIKKILTAGSYGGIFSIEYSPFRYFSCVKLT